MTPERPDREPAIVRAIGTTRLTCGRCRARFEIPFRHSIPLAGGRTRLDRYRAIDRVIADEIRFHRNRACPVCGAAPVRGTAGKRAIGDLCVGGSVIGLAVLLAPLYLFTAVDGSRADLLLLSLIALAILQALGHAAVAVRFGMAATLRAKRATQTLRAKVLEPDVAGRLQTLRVFDRRWGAMILAVSIAAPAIPLAFLASNRGDVNEGPAPALVGPGQRATVPLSPQFTAPRGAWWGTVEAKWTNAESLGRARSDIAATVPTAEPRNLSISDDERTFHPEVEIAIPDDDALIGHTLELDILVRPTVPTQVGFRYEGEKRPDIRERHTIRVSSRSDALLYRKLLRLGLILGLAGIGAGALWPLLCDFRLGKCPAPEVIVTDSIAETGDERPSEV